MPLGGLLTIGGGLLSSLFGGIAGGANTRPPALNSIQSGALNSLLSQLMQNVSGPVKIDPTQQALMYGNVAENQTGANNAVTNSLVSRGLGHSGILGNALTQVANQAQQSRNQGNMGLQQQAIQQRQANIQDILGLLNVNATPGQSPFGGFMAGLAPTLAYSIQNGLNRNSTNQNSGGGGGFNPGFPGGTNGNPYFDAGTQ
jgi:hypothetical protein